MTEGAQGAVGAALTGLAAAIAEARGAAEQLELLPSRTVAGTFEGDRVRTSVRRRGRPSGAQNVATRDMKEFCRRVFGLDPMLEGFRWLQHSPESLAIELGCTKLEAFDRLESLRKELARYFYAPMQAVDEDGKPVPTFNLVLGDRAPGAQRPPWEYLEETQENQALLTSAPAVSQGDVSQGAEK